MPRCSIVIPVYNRASLTRQCLASLLSHGTPEGQCEIIVVDDGSRDCTSQVLSEYDGRIKVVTHAGNLGFAEACNDGAKVAAGSYLVFLNNDTMPMPRWLDALVDYADVHGEAGIVGSKLLFTDSTVQHAGVVICQDKLPRHIYSGFPAEHAAVNKSRRFQAVTGACMLVRRQCFERLGGFDADFNNGYEDVDLCLRLGEQGFEVHYCHSSVVYHYESVSDGRFGSVEANTFRYLRRWGDRVQPDDVQFYFADGLLRFGYRDLYPLHLEVSPLLALCQGDEQMREADRLLGTRAAQVRSLLRTSIDLTVRLLEQHSAVPHADLLSDVHTESASEAERS